MTRYIGTKPLVEGALLAGIAVVLALAATYLPVAGMLLFFLLPVPIALMELRHGTRPALLSVFVTGAVLSAFIGPLQAVSLTATLGLVGVAFGFGIRNRFSPTKTLLLGTVALLVTTVLSVSLSFLFLGVSPFQIQEEMLEAVRAVSEMYERWGVDEEIVRQTRETLEASFSAFRLVFPAAFVAGALLNSLLNFSVLRMVLNRLGHNVNPLPAFAEWTLPKALLGLYAAGIIGLMLQEQHGIAWVNTIFVNVYLLGTLGLTVQGVATGYHFMTRYKWPKAAKVGVSVYVLFVPLLQTAAVILGMLDLLFDYRKLGGVRR